jgi:hypothetical protein
LNHQPRAYEAYSCVSPPSIPKTMLIAFSLGRAGASLLDFRKRRVNIPSTLPNRVFYCKQIARFDRRLSSIVSWSGLQIESPLLPPAESGTVTSHLCPMFLSHYHVFAGSMLVGSAPRSGDPQNHQQLRDHKSQSLGFGPSVNESPQRRRSVRISRLQGRQGSCRLEFAHPTELYPAD